MFEDVKKLILKCNPIYFNIPTVNFRNIKEPLNITQSSSLSAIKSIQRMNIVEEMPIVDAVIPEEPLHPNVTVRDKKTKTKAKPKAKKETIDQQTWTFLNKSVETHLIQFKQDIQHKLNVLELIRTDSSEEERTKMREFMEYVFEYPKLVLSKPESSTTSTTTAAHETPTDVALSTIESVEQPYCIAKRSDGVQCTRKKKKNCEFCGTHAKIEQLQSEKNQSSPLSVHKMEVNAVVIHGIIYYIDVNNNVYHTEDILENKENPRIIAKAVKYGDNSYSIPDLF